VRIPDVVFDGGDLTLRMGNKTLQLLHTPGHTPDSLVVYIKEDKILFSADTVMPVPFIVDGDPRVFIDSLKLIRGWVGKCCPGARRSRVAGRDQ